jgi:hypothetical protein
MSADSSIHHLNPQKPEDEPKGVEILTANQRYPGAGKVEILSATERRKVGHTHSAVEIRDRRDA